MSVPPPEPIEFTLESAELLRACPARWQADSRRFTVPLLGCVILLQSVTPLALTYGHHTRYDPPMIVLYLYPSIMALLVAIAASRKVHIGSMIRTTVATRVTFGDATFDVVLDGKERGRSIPMKSIRSVSATTDAILIEGNAWPMLVIPKRTLPDGGDDLMRYFEDRLVGKRMLRRSTSSATTIINSLPRCRRPSSERAPRRAESP